MNCVRITELTENWGILLTENWGILPVKNKGETYETKEKTD